MIQYISIDKVIKALKTLKKLGHKYYQFSFENDDFVQRCKDSDIDGFNFLYPEDEFECENVQHKKEEPCKDMKQKVPIVPPNDEILQLDINEVDREASESENCDNCDEEYAKKDSVKKWQFAYNSSICLSDNYPEIHYQDEISNDISVAPGEGKIPTNILQEKDWDIKSFPCLHPDGKNSLHTERKVKLSDQDYFTQRIMNKDLRFANNPGYVFASTAYIELKQISSRKGIAFQRGKRSVSNDGSTIYSLEDPFSVLDNIKNTPKYWQKTRYELMARLENLGPFSFFFTLSCADLRWPENFTALLQDQIITYKEVDYHEQIFVGPEGNQVTLEEYLARNLSKYNFIKTNLLNATLTFHQRVKMFIKHIIMSKGNPMHIRYYSYKVEFALRGAGHIHGILWVDWEKFDDRNNLKKDIINALKKIQSEETLEPEDKCV